MAAPDGTGRRVKLYSLNESRQWDDKGTGHVTLCYQDSLDGMSLQVKNESNGSILLESKIQQSTQYRKQQPTLIVWTESDNYDLALSFQERDGCNEIWEKICNVQGRDPYYENNDDEEQEEVRINLVECEKDKLDAIIEQIIAFSQTSKRRDALATEYLEHDYIKKLLSLFRVAEEKQDLPTLYKLYETFKQLFLYYSPIITEIMLSEEHLMDLIGVMEYEPPPNSLMSNNSSETNSTNANNNLNQLENLKLNDDQVTEATRNQPTEQVEQLVDPSQSDSKENKQLEQPQEQQVDNHHHHHQQNEQLIEPDNKLQDLDQDQQDRESKESNQQNEHLLSLAKQAKREYLLASILTKHSPPSSLSSRLDAATSAIPSTTDLNSKKFKRSILSTMAYTYCSIKDYDKALVYMQKELEVESELEDIERRCRVLGNLGNTYFKLRKFDKSLESHRKQVELALKSNLYQQAADALNAIGHVHATRNDFISAQTSHTNCLQILKQLGDNYDFDQHRQILSIAHTHTMRREYALAEDRYKEALRLIQGLNCKMNKEEYQTGMCMLHFNLAYLDLKRQNLLDAQQNYKSVIEFAREMANTSVSPTNNDFIDCASGSGKGDTIASDTRPNIYSNSKTCLPLTSVNSSLKRKAELIEMRALSGMGHAFRIYKNFTKARDCFQKQHQLAKTLEDKAGQSQALSNLGMTYQQNPEDFEKAKRYFEENLELVDKDPLLKAYAQSHMGNIYFLMANYSNSLAHYQESLNLFKDLDYCSNELKTTTLNMAAVREKMHSHHHEMSLPSSSSLKHHHQHQKKLMISS